MSALHHVSNRPILSRILPDQTKHRESDGFNISSPTSSRYRKPSLKVTLASIMHWVDFVLSSHREKQKFDLLRFNCLWGDCAERGTKKSSVFTDHLPSTVLYLWMSSS
jgi:hypothetical protein